MSCFKSGHYGAEVLAIIFIDKVKPHHRGRRIFAEITATSWDSMQCHKILYRAAIHNRIKSLSWINPLQAAAAPFLLSKMISNEQMTSGHLLAYLQTILFSPLWSCQSKGEHPRPWICSLSHSGGGQGTGDVVTHGWRWAYAKINIFMLEEGKSAFVLLILLGRWEAPFHDSVTIPHSRF